MTIQFHTKVSKGGIIRIPKRFKIDESEVEITVRQKAKGSDEKISAKDFVKEWKGFLKGIEFTKADRINYLIEKYK
jgi:hypothetical protein